VVEAFGGSGEKLNELEVFDVAFPAYYCVLFRKWKSRTMEDRAKYRLVKIPGGEVWRGNSADF
jgi:hypothetical protein